MFVIELVEEKTKDLSQAALSEAGALALYRDRHFELEFPNPANGYCYRLRSKGWIGHIPIAGEVLVRITPKISVSNVFRMLEVAYNLKSFAILDGQTHIESLEDIYERIASILARRVLDRARQGLFRTYVRRQDDLIFVRGRIDIRGNLRNILSGSPRTRCDFKELTADLDDNRILLWTLNLASRLGPQREVVRRDVRQAYRALAGTVRLVRQAPADCIGRIYHRLNEDYRPLHGLCRFLLEQTGPDIGIGRHEFLPFTLNMPNLFEAFVAEWLRIHLPAELAVNAQHTVTLQGTAQLTFRIDLVLRDRASGRALAVLDTKYKTDEVPTEADIQQVVAYAVEIGVGNAFLIYPATLAQPITAKVGDIQVRSVAFDLASDLDLAGPSFLAEVLRHCTNRTW